MAEVPFSFCAKLEEALPMLRALGYDGVELLLRRAEDVDAGELERLLAKHDMELSAIGTGLAATDGLYLGSREEGTRRDAVKRVLGFSKLAERFDCGVVVGSIKGGVVPAPSSESLVKSMTELKEIRLFIEPLNRYESAFINKAYQAVEIVKEQNLERSFVLLDTFHMNIEEKSMADAIRSAGERLGHFHIADSNRRAPGDGHIPFAEIFRALKEIHYDGYVSAEILQEPTSEVALRKTVEFVRSAH